LMKLDVWAFPFKVGPENSSFMKIRQE
jgi:hypothetical protein